MPEKNFECSIQTWGYSRPGWMGPWAAWSSIRHGGWQPCLQQGGWTLILEVPSSPTHSMILILCRGNLGQMLGRKFFTQRVMRHWHSCPERLWIPLPGGTRGQVGWGPGQPELVGGSPQSGTEWAWRSLQPKPFCGSVIL